MTLLPSLNESMDADLAFCLGQFIDDQVQIIDERIEAIQNEEDAACRQIEQDKINFEKKKPPPKNKGSRYEDQTLVDRLIQELRDDGATKDTKTIIDDETCIATLRAEASTKVNAASKYISRLRSLAKPLPNTTNFVKACAEQMDYFNRTQEFDRNFKELLVILEETDASNVLENVRRWWKNAYGSAIAELNTRNNKINPAINDNNYPTLSQTNRIIDNARKLIAARTIVVVEPPKLEIIRRFVRRLLALDEEKREQTNEEELINHLNSLPIEQIINYAQQWFDKRDKIRNQKEEPDPCMYMIINISLFFSHQYFQMILKWKLLKRSLVDKKLPKKPRN